jgi:hypothetical protein
MMKKNGSLEAFPAHFATEQTRTTPIDQERTRALFCLVGYRVVTLLSRNAHIRAATCREWL